MPELPEVEIVKRSLKNKVNYKKIKKIIITNRDLRFKIQKNFEKNLEGRIITNVSRFSKYIILVLDNNNYCLIHLGMSGTLHLVDYKKKEKMTNLSFYHSKILPKNHNHIRIKFSNFTIIYNDPRRFGFIKYFNSHQKLNNFFKNYGPDPFEKSFNIKYLKKKLKDKKKNIKNLLLDQKFISGIGNIYANEILFYSKINPFKKGENISNYEINKILKISKSVLNKAIKKGGSSIRDFKNSKGKKGSYQEEFAVYGREKKNCKSRNCNFKIIKINISNRSTYICNNCQKK